MKHCFRKGLTILLLILILITTLVICKNKKEKAANLDKEKTVTEVTSIALEPMEKANASSSSKVRITSSSKKILQYIANKVPDYIWLPASEGEFMNPMDARIEINKRKAVRAGSSGYYIEIPIKYFQSDDSSCYKGVKEFDFSGLDLGAVTLLPDFSKW